MTCSVSSILRADYRGDGVQQVVVCGIEGEVSGAELRGLTGMWEVGGQGRVDSGGPDLPPPLPLFRTAAVQVRGYTPPGAGQVSVETDFTAQQQVSG